VAVKQTFFRFLPLLMLILLTSCAWQQEPVHVQLLSINDFHGKLNASGELDNQPVGSAPYLGRYIQQQRAKASTLLIHAGDLVGGSPPLSALLQDEPTITFANQLKFDLGTVGNHEFDEGVAELKRLIHGGYHPKTGQFGGAHFPYIVANVRMKKTGQPLLPPYAIKKVSGIPIGFIGVVSKDTVHLVSPEGIEEIEFIDEATAINQQVEALKKKGVRSIVVIAHEGGTQQKENGEINGPIAQIAQRIDAEVDVILSGHTHTRLNGKVADKLIVQAYSYGMAMAKVDLIIDPQSQEVVQKSGEIIPAFHHRIKPDPQGRNLCNKYKPKSNPSFPEKSFRVSAN
jgi:5'-nucleotidase